MTEPRESAERHDLAVWTCVPGRWSQAECSCGWRGPARFNPPSRASRDCAEHLADVKPPEAER